MRGKRINAGVHHRNHMLEVLNSAERGDSGIANQSMVAVQAQPEE
jgi:hypothetical protein